MISRFYRSYLYTVCLSVLKYQILDAFYMCIFYVAEKFGIHHYHHHAN